MHASSMLGFYKLLSVSEIVSLVHAIAASNLLSECIVKHGTAGCCAESLRILLVMLPAADSTS